MKTFATPITVIIADDHPIVRDGFKKMISKSKEIKLVGEAENGEELIKVARLLKPDVIIADIRMPVMDGIEATKKIKAILPETEIIALSMFNDLNVVVDMLNAGAKGYILKNAGKEQITEAIKTVYEKKPYYCSDTLDVLRNRTDTKKPALTKKEIEIIKLICKEYSTKQIASSLYLDIRTVEWYRNQILDKLNLKNTAGIVMYAAKNNIC
jgi:DNA-binding NarL/FixJ family response regulator